MKILKFVLFVTFLFFFVVIACGMVEFFEGLDTLARKVGVQ